MGRKIPAKKHRGVKDPLAQQAKRLQSLKGKINAPPKDPDEQPVPKSLIRLFGLENPKTKDKGKKKKHKTNKSIGQGKVQNPVSKLQRLPGESGRSFSLRINGAIRALNGSAEELHYPMDTEEDDVKGVRMEEHRRRRERKRRRGAPAAEPRPTRAQRLTLKKKAKKEAAKQNEGVSAEVVYERVAFGEVAHAPPALRPAPSASRKLPAAAPRPGRRDLLLSRLLEPAPAPAPAPAPSPAERLRRERARVAAVAAYRALKHQPPAHRPTQPIL